MSFDNESSNRDNDTVLDRQDRFEGVTIGDVLALREKRREENEYAAEWLETSDWDTLNDDVVETADGCSVEPDGACEHGYSSPLVVLGII